MDATSGSQRNIPVNASASPAQGPGEEGDPRVSDLAANVLSNTAMQNVPLTKRMKAYGISSEECGKVQQLQQACQGIFPEGMRISRKEENRKALLETLPVEHSDKAGKIQELLAGISHSVVVGGKDWTIIPSKMARMHAGEGKQGRHFLAEGADKRIYAAFSSLGEELVFSKARKEIRRPAEDVQNDIKKNLAITKLCQGTGIVKARGVYHSEQKGCIFERAEGSLYEVQKNAIKTNPNQDGMGIRTCHTFNVMSSALEGSCVCMKKRLFMVT